MKLLVEVAERRANMPCIFHLPFHLSLFSKETWWKSHGSVRWIVRVMALSWMFILGLSDSGISSQKVRFFSGLTCFRDLNSGIPPSCFIPSSFCPCSCSAKQQVWSTSHWCPANTCNLLFLTMVVAGMWNLNVWTGKNHVPLHGFID